MKFKTLPVGAHYRIFSFDGVLLPTVRVKVSDSHYKMLHPTNGIKRLAAGDTMVNPVSDEERRTGVRR